MSGLLGHARKLSGGSSGHNRNLSSGGQQQQQQPQQPTPTQPSIAQQIQQQHFDIAAWDRKSKFSIEQSLVINDLSKTILDKPLPLKFANDQQQIKQENNEIDEKRKEEQVEDEDDIKLPAKRIENLGQFYDWFTLIEKTSNHLHQYEWYLETIISYGEGSDHLLNHVNNCESLVNSIQSDYVNLTKKTNQLHDSCEKFFKEELRLRYLVQTIHEKLKYYLELEPSTKRFNSSTFSATDVNFISSLETLEDCIQFMKKNPNYIESTKYSIQYNILYTRALGLIKDYISAGLKIITKEVVTSQKLQQNDLDNDYHISNIKFRAFAPKLKPFCLELEKRAIGNYSSFIKDCHSNYFKNRKIVLSPIIYQKLLEITSKPQQENVALMIQNICIYMVQIFETENQIYCDFFDKPNSNYGELLDEFSQQLYDTVRPVYIHIPSYESLCNLAHLIRNELLDDTIEQSAKYCNGLKMVVQRMLQDIQERLLFIIQTFIRDEIRCFAPKPEDLDYPNKLVLKQDEEAINNQNQQNIGNSLQTISLYSKWYPTLEKTLMCLSKLYLVVDTKIFEGLAQEAVEACTFTLMKASLLIAAKPDPLSMVDSQLFLIKYFIILREQITPFDINFVIIEKIVDFPNLKHALSSLYNYGSLFALSSNNPIYNLIVSSANPRVTNTSIDSKKDLEKELKTVIESFILTTSNNIVDPLLSLLTKISVYLNQNPQQAASLSTQPFADPTRIKEVVAQGKLNVETQLPKIIERMRIYLAPSTLALLTKPIRTNIVDSFDQINQYSRKYYTDQQIQSMELVTMDSLKLILDKIILPPQPQLNN